MATAIKPTNDAVFKIIFASKANTEILKSLIESVVGRRIEHVVIENPYVDVRSINSKKPILDVKAKALFEGSEETYNIEIQVKKQEFFHNRSLFYWAQSYGSQLNKSGDYAQLRKHICINFLQFTLFDHGKFRSKYVIMEEIEKTQLTDHLELYFVQMPLSEYNKKKQSIPDDATLLEKWVYFLLYGDQLSSEEVRKLNPSIENAYKALQELDEKDRIILQEIYKREKDTLAQINHGKRLGFVEQIEEIAQEAGLVVPSDLKDDLMWKDYEKLKAFVKYLYSKQWDPAMLRNEIEGFRK